MSRRPAVDVIVPALAPVPAATRLARLSTSDGDTLTVVDNRPHALARDAGRVRIVAAPERQSSYYARNRGAAVRGAEWLLFVDADVDFEPDLLDRLFATPPAARTGVLAGTVIDEVVADTPVARWLRDRSAMGQGNTLDRPWPYAQTAHCGVRREAFEAVGGFRDVIRSGGDADLCFRLAAQGWGIERRDAAVRHAARSSNAGVLRQMARHGAGAAWLEREHPGSFPDEDRPLGLAWWLARSVPQARHGREAAVQALLPPAAALAFSLGRRLPNDVGRSRRLDQLLR